MLNESSRTLLALLLSGPLLAVAAEAQLTSRVSLDSSGAEGNANSSRPDVSDDGQWITYYSDASNLVAGDTNAVSDIFLHDRLSGATTRISVSSGGVEANGASSRPRISGDGRYVAFYSDATNLVPNDTNAFRDVFVHDRISGTTVLVSTSTGGTQGNGESSRAAISENGRYVAFRSYASNLVAGDLNGFGDVFLHDRDTDGDSVYDEPGAVSTVLVSVNSSGAQGNQLSSVPNLSADGRYVTFRSEATNLVAGDTNGLRDVFVRDTLAGTTVRVSVSTGGTQGNGDSSRPTISADGRFVAFYSDAQNLVPGDNNQYCFLDPFNQLICGPASDCFVRDRDTDEDGLFDEAGAVKTVRVSVTSAGGQANDRSEDPDISPDGRFVTFWTDATNLFPGDNNAAPDVMLHDRDQDGNGTYDEAGGISTTLVSRSSAGVQANADSKRQVVSANGAFVIFRSNADNLVAADNNLVPDVFVFEVSGSCSASVSYCTPGSSASGCQALISATGTASATASSGFVVTASAVEGSKDGLFFFGQNGRQANPWGNGTSFQCVVPPVRRAGLLTGTGTPGACDGMFGQDLNARWCPVCPKPLHAPTVGVPVQIQLWYRDPQSSSNQTTSLSDALEFDVCP